MHAQKLGINIENDFKEGFKASGRFGDTEEDAQLLKEGLLKTICVPGNLAMLS